MQDREAIVGRGKYQFRKKFQYLKIAEADWFLMTREQREKHFKKVHQVNVLFNSTTVVFRVVSVFQYHLRNFRIA